MTIDVDPRLQEAASPPVVAGRPWMLAGTWVSRWLTAALVSMVGTACIAIAIWTLTSRDWHPTRELQSDDLSRIRNATEFVETSKKSLARMPTMKEFDVWSRSAPAELHLDGVGFSYGSFGTTVGAVYAFDWYGGRGTWLSWRSDTSSPELADVSPSVYFFFGHKLVDIVVFFGLGVLALAVAGWIVRYKNVKDAR